MVDERIDGAVPMFRLLNDPISVEYTERGKNMLNSIIITKIYPICVVGLSGSGKSFLLNAIILILTDLGYLKGDDPATTPNKFVSSSNRGGDFGVTKGSDAVVLYLRHGNEPWAGGAILLHDFEGLMMDDHPGLSVLLALASQLTSELFYVDLNFNDTLRANLARLVAAGLVQCDGRGNPNWPFLTVVVNQRNVELPPDSLETMFDVTRGNEQRQKSSAVISFNIF